MIAPPPGVQDRGLRSPLGAALTRGLAYFLLWVVLMQRARPGDLIMGAVATCLATWVSLRLLPPGAGRLRIFALAALMPHLLWESIVAGFDVARRALDPRLPLKPGFIDCPLSFPPGMARNTFATITSLMPGAVPCDEAGDVLVYHCLDSTQNVVDQLWKEERLLARALIAGRGHD
jgi:multicomponent Na+:H+ antiporter subunit E